MITRVEVRTFLEKWLHDGCGGEFNPTGISLMSNPPQYPHVCNKCGKEETSRGFKFPRTVIEEIHT